MKKTFFIDIDKLSLTQYYLSKDRLNEVEKHFKTHSLEDYPPLPIKKFGSIMLLIDDHHFAYYLYNKGKQIAEVYEALDDNNFIIHLKYYNECIKKNLKVMKDLENRILSKKNYENRWLTPKKNNVNKLKENPLYNLKVNVIDDKNEKLTVVRQILNPIPAYFTNDFMFEDYIKKIEDMHTMSFSLYNQNIAFTACKKSYDNSIEIYMLGIHDQVFNTKIVNIILNYVKKYAKSLDRKYITVKTPVKVQTQNDISTLYDLYLKHGFTHIANLQSPWNEKKFCILLIKN